LICNFKFSEREIDDCVGARRRGRVQAQVWRKRSVEAHLGGPKGHFIAVLGGGIVLPELAGGQGPELDEQQLVIDFLF
jgi:hypothetical protein